MTRGGSRLLCLAALAVLATACRPATGDSTTGVSPVALPADSTLSRIPLGAPPGTPLDLATDIPNPDEGDAVAVGQGKTLFGAMNCVYCHGSGGSGLIGPPLNGPGWRYGGTPAQIFNSIHDGRPQGMPAWGASLPPDQIWKLVAYIESLGGATSPATPKMVQIAGAQPSQTGEQPAEQSKADSAHEGLMAADKANGGG
jgi:cytochrome c oxidase cbb3-type subunit 3